MLFVAVGLDVRLGARVVWVGTWTDAPAILEIVEKMGDPNLQVPEK